jgi:hypothetical protein
MHLIGQGGVRPWGRTPRAEPFFRGLFVRMPVALGIRLFTYVLDMQALPQVRGFSGSARAYTFSLTGKRCARGLK